MNNQFPRRLFSFLAIGVLTCGCGYQAATQQGGQASPTFATILPSVTPLPSPTATLLPSPTDTAVPSPTDTPTPVPVPLALEPFSKANASKINNLSVIRYTGEEGPVQMTFSPDGIYIIIMSRNLFLSSPTAMVSVRNIATGEVVSSFEVPENSVLNPNGTQVITFSEGKLLIYAAVGGKMIAEQDAGGLISNTLFNNALLLSPDGRFLVTQPSSGTLGVWDIQQGSSVSTIIFAGSYIHSAAFSQDDTMLVVRSFDDVYVYDTTSGQQITQVNSQMGDTHFFTGEAVISPDGSIVGISGSTTVAVMQLWDVHNGKLLATWSGIDRSGGPYQALFSPNGRLLAYSNWSDNIRVLDAHTGKLVRTFQANAALAFSRDGQFFAAASRDGVVNLWDMDSGTLLTSLPGHAPQVEQMIFNQDGSLLASRGFDATIRLWGEPPSGVAVVRAGVSISQNGGFSGMDSEVPQSWLASGSNPARYLISLTLQKTIVKSCPYTDNHTLNKVNNNLLVTITDLETNTVIALQTFEGIYSSADCPETRTFMYQTEEEVVGHAAPAEFKAWLLQVMAPLGFTP